MTLAEAIFSSIGDELTELSGFYTTRMTGPVQTENQFQTATSGADFAGDPAVIVTLSSGTFDPAVAAGQRFRVLSGPAAGSSALILSRDSGVQITLQATLTGVAAFTDEAWEIVNDAATSLPVENTLGFPTSGRVVVQGRVYAYTSTTATTIDGITYDDGTGTVTSGVAQDHTTLAEVADFSRTMSALDIYRNSFLVDTATGTDLDIVGNNVGVPRPAELSDDDIYRELIKAIAYAPRGTIFAIEQALDVLIGPGLYEIFEDLTSGSPIQNHNRVFITVTGGGANERFAGKAYLESGDGDELSLDDDTTLTMPDTAFIKIHGIQPQAEEGPFDVDGSTVNQASSVDLGITITGPASTFSDRIISGDIFELTDGNFGGVRATVVSRDSDQQLTLGVVQGLPNPSSELAGGIGLNFTNASWRVIREKDNLWVQRPSSNQILEAGSVVTPWEYVGANEVTRVTPNSNGGLGFLNLAFNPNNDIVAYRKRLRIRPEDTVIVEFTCDPDTSLTSTDSPEQFALIFGDGNRMITFGAQLDSVNPHVNAGFFALNTGLFFNVAAPGDFIWSGQASTQFTPNFNTIIIEKIGTERVRLWRRNDASGAVLPQNNTPLELVAEVPYTSFLAASSAIALLQYTTPTDRDLVWGTLIPNVTAQTRWRQIAYKIIPKSEFANEDIEINRGDTGLSASNSLQGLASSFSTGTFPAGGNDIGRRVRIKDAQNANVSGGNALGEWEITSQNSATEVLVTGATYNRGSFTFVNRSTLVVRDNEDAFIWPRVMGHSVEILDGVNAGTYPILGVIDNVTGKRFEDPAVASEASLQAQSSNTTDATFPAGSGPQLVVVGNVAGVRNKIPVNITAGSSVAIPATFDVGTVTAIELVPVISGGRRGEETFQGDITVTNTGDGLTVLTIPAGETSAGKPTLTALKDTPGAFFDLGKAGVQGQVNTLANQPVEHASDTVLLDTSSLPGGLFTVEAEEVRWRIIPNFPIGDCSFDVVDLVLESATAGIYTRRDFPTWPDGYGSDPANLELMSVYRTKVLSGQIHDTNVANSVISFPLQQYTLYPAYLNDQLGFARNIVDILTAAGVIADFGSLFVDNTGFHISEG